MAGAVVSAVLQQLQSVAGQEIKAGMKLVTGVDEQVKMLTTNFQMIQAVLADAELRQVNETEVGVWLKKLKDVSHEMEDVLDTWNTAIMERLQLEGSNDAHTLTSKVRSSFLFPFTGLRQVILNHDIASKIRAINKSLDDIAKEKERFDFEITTTSEQPRRTVSMSSIGESAVFGRDEEKNSLISKLLNESSERQTSLHIISIVGTEGIGKTTLAQLAYDDEDVIRSFDRRIWVCVSTPFDELMTAKAINEALGGDNSGLVKLESVIQNINEFIVGKKFLLVLDDVWTEDFVKWEWLHHCLKDGLHGSKVLVTTRNQTTAMMEWTDIITLDELSNEQCWAIFRRFAFFGRSDEDCVELEEIGRKIASKCKGLPLTAKTLGSLLRPKNTREEWENILSSEMWEEKKFEEGVVPLLSYYDVEVNQYTPFNELWH